MRAVDTIVRLVWPILRRTCDSGGPWQVRESRELGGLLEESLLITVGTTITGCPGRSLAHPVLIADRWRQSERRERNGARGAEVTNAEPSGSVHEIGCFWLRRRRAQVPNLETPPDS
jgi:hypothetical protein